MQNHFVSKFLKTKQAYQLCLNTRTVGVSYGILNPNNDTLKCTYPEQIRMHLRAYQFTFCLTDENLFVKVMYMQRITFPLFQSRFFFLFFFFSSFFPVTVRIIGVAVSHRYHVVSVQDWQRCVCYTRSDVTRTNSRRMEEVTPLAPLCSGR